MFLEKPVVTFRNSQPRAHLIDIESATELEPALKLALTRPDELMARINSYTLIHEAHRDCQCSERVLDAVDEFNSLARKGLKRKPLNLIRKWQVRKKLHFYPLLHKISNIFK